MWRSWLCPIVLQPLRDARVPRAARLAAVMLAGVLLGACKGDPQGASRGGARGVGGAAPAPAAMTPRPEPCTPARFCTGTSEVTRSCDTGTSVESSRDCAALGMTCYASVGCALCQPSLSVCEGNSAMTCRADGSGYDAPKACDLAAGEVCEAGVCMNLCAGAQSGESYIGCEYWPLPVLNSQLDVEFEFAVIVANPQRVPASVTLALGAKELSRVEVPVGGVRSIPLPWIDALKGEPGEERSALVSPGAYRLRSNVPVTVYQFNPLEYRIDRDCKREAERDSDMSMDGECFSYSNDASLLLPTHVFARDYIVVSRPTMLNRVQNATLDAMAASPGFFAVVGVEPGGVDVTIDVAAHVVASTDTTIEALAPGGRAKFRLQQGDVLQIVSQAPEACESGPIPPDMLGEPGSNVVSEVRSYCHVGPEYDLTGSEVHATGKIGVISGHNCSFVPYGRWACDHQEEQLFPLQAWGKDYLVSITRPLREEPNVIRIVSGADGNRVHFQPPVHGDVTLDRGEMVEFETQVDFQAVGSQPMLVAQFLVGQDYAGLLSAGPMGLGDPSLSLAVPTEQYRTSYSILVPQSYLLNLINVTAPEGQSVELDGMKVMGFTPVPGTGMSTARIEVGKGQHDLRSTVPFGVVSYGFGTYTSYMYPAGLDLERINDLQ